MNYWKLIELLNEFDKPLGWYYEDWVLDCKLNLYEYMAYEWICSARYWFIKWLVENEKIDLDKLPKHLQWEWVNTDIKWEELVIMVLSIQDEPIEFLISILK